VWTFQGLRHTQGADDERDEKPASLVEEENEVDYGDTGEEEGCHDSECPRGFDTVVVEVVEVFRIFQTQQVRHRRPVSFKFYEFVWLKMSVRTARMSVLECKLNGGDEYDGR
jgi:hypothetical protein